VSSSTGPDFLGIGVSRAGTTFIYEWLRSHPRVWLTPQKELHFFDQDQYDWSRSSGDAWVVRAKMLVGAVHRARPDWKSSADLRFCAKNFFRWGRSIRWYRSLFPRNPKGTRVGEITPLYSSLSEDRVAQIAQQFPGLRIIIVLRHPLERALSMYLKNVRLRGGSEGNDGWRFSEGVLASFDYLTIVERWRRYFGKERVCVMFFDDLQANPSKFIEAICAFLEVGPLRADSDQLKRVVNSSKTGSRATLPSTASRQLAEGLLPSYRRLAEREGGVTVQWHRDLASVLRQGDEVLAQN
jgi:hypothetical protein